ncbi:MAG TPA: M10 family metallopeptidase C-terminal domain-containing protein, partial [Sphingomicrobium sp.]|nr:M10 family metallopeptidase C-terminal domain-containing protein [Sphingomicrobium sp.]
MTDIAGDTSTTAVVTPGSEISSAINSLGDHDWFKVTLAAGQSTTITVTGGGNLDTYLNVYDPTGTTILASNDDIVNGVNPNSRLTFTAAAAGTYFIDVGAFHDQSTGTYDLFVEPTQPPVFTDDQIAFQLTNGYWGGDVHHWAVTQGGTLTVNISTLTAPEQTLARAALHEWADVIGIHFQEVSVGGQIVFSDAEDATANGPVAQTDANWSSNGIISSAHVQISQSWVNTYGTSFESYSFQTYVHEIGHALGLGHSGEYNSTATYSSDALFANDSWSTSVMSYFDQQQNTYFANQGFSRLYALTPMAADVAAMQSLYGLSTNTRTGDTVYGDNSNAGGIYDAIAYPRAAVTIFDSGGNDTIDYSRVGVSQLINLNPETFSNVNGFVGNLSIAPGTIIENAIGGSGNDTIIGNSADNVLTGGLGSDTLTGGGGHDAFKDTEAGHNGDTITDFHVGDFIVFTDATLGNFTYTLSGSGLTYTGGSMTVDGFVGGKFSVSAAASGGVELSGGLKSAVHNDVSGDGRSDVLWRSDDGTVHDWLAQADNSGSFADNTANLNTIVPTSWHIAGTGDFNGDGRVDVLWRNDDGTVHDWLGQANGSFAGNTANLNTTVPT